LIALIVNWCLTLNITNYKVVVECGKWHAINASYSIWETKDKGTLTVSGDQVRDGENGKIQSFTPSYFHRAFPFPFPIQ